MADVTFEEIKQIAAKHRSGTAVSRSFGHGASMYSRQGVLIGECRIDTPQPLRQVILEQTDVVVATVFGGKKIVKNRYGAIKAGFVDMNEDGWLEGA